MTMAPFNNAPETGTRNGRTAGRGAGAGALVGGAVFVSVIALCALVIAYNGIYQFALLVHEEGTFLAHVFPVTFTLLVLMAFWVSYVLRAAPPGERLWVDVVLIPLLILAAAVPMVLNSMGMVESLGANQPRIVQVVVAVAPMAALLVAFLLWITVRAHIRRRGNGVRPRPQPSDDRATVLRSRPGTQVGEARVRDEREPEALKTRLLRLGADEDEEDVENAELAVSSADRGDDRVEARSETWAEAGDRPADAEDEEYPLPEATPLPTRTSTLRRDRAEQREKERLEREERERAAAEREAREREEREELERRELEEREWAERERAEEAEEAFAEAGAAGYPDTADTAGPEDPTEPIPTAGRSVADTAEDGEPDDLAEASVPTLPLPRRARGSGNPIKRAAAEPPVVPGAAAPAPEPNAGAEAEDTTWDSAEAEQVVVVPEHLADEGFEHDSPIADPSTDEAEAPAPASAAIEPAAEAEVEPEAEAEVEPEVAVEDEAEQVTAEAFDDTDTFDNTVELWPPDEAGADPLPEVEDLPREEEPETVPGSAATAEPAAEHSAGVGALWEPPSDDTEPSSLADYVPPVWTPPEDDTPAEPAPMVGMATEDAEDTTPALDHDTGPEVRAAFRLGSVPPGAARPAPEPEPVAEYEPEPEPVVEYEPEPEQVTERMARPAPRPREPLQKRPMVLKPKRPPMPDFASGPPSRRVRSEPLPPDER